ncbi:hypothetical protein [Paenibacillus lautus]|uniref:hypothetical protein n=1 Tax=Paenibacillus lautus TaxID=1401 RepID=UPI003D2D8E48
MNNDQKILKIAEPAINGYPKHAIQLAVLCQHDSSLSWILSNYIQLRCPKSINDRQYSSWLDFYFIDPKYTDSLLYTELLSRKTILAFHKDNFIDFLISCINLDHYIYTSVNEFYIPHTTAFQKYYFPHSILIFGYDLKKETFNVGGFVNKSIGNKFTRFDVSFKDIEKAYMTLEVTDDDNYLNRFYLMKINHSKKYSFDPVIVKELLQDYLDSKNTSERLRGFYNPNNDFYYGMKIYDNLKLNYNMENIDCSDVRPLYILWEHKACMLTRIKYLSDNNYIKKESFYYKDYNEVERKSLICKNLYLKYQVTRDKKIVYRLLSFLESIIEEEKIILHNLLEDIYSI